MSRDAGGHAHLRSARQAALKAKNFVGQRTFAEYESDEMLRAAVERQVAVLGRSLRRASGAAAPESVGIPDVAQLSALEHQIVHEYWAIDDRAVWDVARNHAPGMIAAISSMLPEDDDA